MIELWNSCKGLAIFLVLFAGFQSNTSAQQESREIAGTIFSADSLTPLSRVTILNIRSRELVVSNPIGNFSIQAAENDTLLLTFIGFASLSIPVKTLNSKPGEKVRIYMMTSVYQLKPVSFTAPRVPQIDHEYYKKLFSRPKPSLSQSPISAIYDRFSKKAISLRKLESDYYEYEYQKLEMSRFRKAIFPLILEDLEMYRLIDHCKLPRTFVQNAIEYDFIFTVRECMKTFPLSKTK